jgi:hypothetical protein
LHAQLLAIWVAGRCPNAASHLAAQSPWIFGHLAIQISIIHKDKFNSMIFLHNYRSIIKQHSSPSKWNVTFD